MTRILITGANRGIGAALTAAAKDKGWSVTGTARDDSADLSFDVTDRDALKQAAAETGPIDVLINNAGIIGPAQQSTTEMDFDGFAQTLAVNTIAPLAVAQAFLPNLRQGTKPRILTISSQMSWMGSPKSDRIAYRASKAAVNKVMQGLATDLYAEGISVALIDPGWVRTDMGGDGADLDPAEVARGIIALADRMTLDQTGKFFKYTGDERAF